MTAPGWLLLAGALALWPGGARSAPRAGSGPARLAAGPAGLFGVVAASAVTCAVALGVERGGVAAVVIAPLVGVLVRQAQRRPQRPDPDPALPLVLDLIAAALRGGRPVPDALALGAPAGRADTAEALNRVAALCRLGADAAQAWAAVSRDGPLSPVVPVAVRSAASGSKLAAAFERLATELRADRAAAAAVRAHRAGVSALAPLAGCFLPSFVCLGVIPVVVGVARTSLGVLR